MHDENSHAADAFRYVASRHKADKSMATTPEARVYAEFNRNQQFDRPRFAIGTGEVHFS